MRGDSWVSINKRFYAVKVPDHLPDTFDFDDDFACIIDAIVDDNLESFDDFFVDDRSYSWRPATADEVLRYCADAIE